MRDDIKTEKEDTKTKLVLKRETLRVLDTDDLDDVAGGFIKVSNSCCWRNSCGGKSPDM